MRYLIRLFYVEHLKSFKLMLIFSIFGLLALTSCKKKLDPTPELRDPVYTALNVELASAKAELAAKENDIKTIKNDMKNAVPQTGEVKVFERRLNDAEEARAFAEQRARLFEIRIEQQKLIANKKYLESQLPNGKPWPNEPDTKSVIEKIKIEKERIQRINGQHAIKKPVVPRGTTDAHGAPAAGGHGDPSAKPAHEAPPAH